jgi:hypothetical protein
VVLPLLLLGRMVLVPRLVVVMVNGEWAWAGRLNGVDY